MYIFIQLLKLLENLECSMISDVRKKLLKGTNLALSERAREESALPTDLWKKPVCNLRNTNVEIRHGQPLGNN